jgi:sugar phosphate isomerase/epimerase
MKYSVSNWIFGKEPLEDGFQRLAKFGYDGIELRGEPRLYKVNEIQNLMERYGIKVLSICGMYPGPHKDQLRDLSHPKVHIRKQAIIYVKELIDLAKVLATPVVIVTPCPVGKNMPLNTKKKEWQWAVESVKEAGNYAGEKGVFLAIEPINRYETYLINSIDEALCFINEVELDSVKIMGDTFHMNIEDADFGLAIRKADRDLIHIHVADSNRQSPGRGHIDFRQIMIALKEIDYQYSLAMEPLPPLSNPYAALSEQVSPDILDQTVRECINLFHFYERIV